MATIIDSGIDLDLGFDLAVDIFGGEHIVCAACRLELPEGTGICNYC